MSARLVLLLPLLALMLLACGKKDGVHVEFSPGEFKVSPLPPATGAVVSYSITGSFAIAEIYQGEERVSVISRADETAQFLAISSTPPKAVVYGNTPSERVELAASAP